MSNQGTHDRGPPGRHAGHPPGSRAPEQPEQHGFRLVVPRVSHGHDIGTQPDAGALEEVVPNLACRLLTRDAPADCLCGHVRLLALEGHREPCGQLAAEPGVPGRLVAAQAVIEMDQAGEREPARAGQLAEQVEERHRVRAARHRGRDASARGEQPPLPDRRRHPRRQRSH